MKYTVIKENDPIMSGLLGTVDDDPHLGVLAVCREGTIADAEGLYYYWRIGRRKDGKILVYIPGIAFKKRKEITEEQLKDTEVLHGIIREVTAMGDK